MHGKWIKVASIWRLIDKCLSKRGNFCYECRFQIWHCKMINKSTQKTLQQMLFPRKWKSINYLQSFLHSRISQTAKCLLRVFFVHFMEQEKIIINTCSMLHNTDISKISFWSAHYQKYMKNSFRDVFCVIRHHHRNRKKRIHKIVTQCMHISEKKRRKNPQKISSFVLFSQGFQTYFFCLSGFLWTILWCCLKMCA